MTKNEIKYFSSLRKKDFRDSEKIFLIEGTHLVTECLQSRYYKNKIIKVFVTKSYDNILLKKIKSLNLQTEILNDDIFNKLSETKNPQGIIAVVKMRNEDEFSDKDTNFLLALDNLNDPGNLGTILRTCWWYGVKNVFISSNSVDIFNSKVIRSSQGAIFNIEIITSVDLKQLLNRFKNEKYEIFLTDLKSTSYLDGNNVPKKNKIFFVFGNEANGINNELLTNPEYSKIKIRGHSNCESLNVGVSVGIVLDYFFNRK